MLTGKHGEPISRETARSVLKTEGFVQDAHRRWINPEGQVFTLAGAWAYRKNHLGEVPGKKRAARLALATALALTGANLDDLLEGRF